MRRKATWGIPGTVEGYEGLPYTSSATGAPQTSEHPWKGPPQASTGSTDQGLLPLPRLSSTGCPGDGQCF